MKGLKLRSKSARGALVAALALSATACGSAAPSKDAAAAAQASPTDDLDASMPALMTRDGIRIGNHFYAAAHPKAIILLFHQAEGSKDEYARIAPKLVSLGYSALAIDQHSGGAMFGRNETVARLGMAMNYDAARQDLDTALDWAETQKLPVIVWGSSYSSALAFELTADNPGKIVGLLAFSPGEYLKGAGRVRSAAHNVRVPVYITMATGETEQARSIYDAVASPRKVFAVPAKRGIHGSSTLDPDRNPAGAADNWRSVTTFLASLNGAAPE